MMIRYARNGEIRYVTLESRALLGYPPEALIGRKTSEFVHPDDITAVRAHKLALHLHPLEDGAEAEAIEFRMKRADGDWVWVEGRPRVICDPRTGSTIETHDALRDISERKAHISAPQSGQGLAAPARELALLAVTINAPPPPADRGAQAGEASAAEIDHGAKVSPTDEKPVTRSVETINLRGLFEDAVALMRLQAQAKALDLALHLDASLPEAVTLDAGRLSQVLTKLVRNAVALTDEGGVRVTARYYSETSRLHCEVLDTSCGVPTDDPEAVFKRAARFPGPTAENVDAAESDLSLAAGLVTALGGEMGVVSLEALGACFWFELPCPLPLSATALVEPNRCLEGVRLLVTDDSSAHRDLVRLMLSPLGVAVTDAASGEEALALTAASPFDVILLNLNMPGMDGAAAARAIRDARGVNVAVPLVALTADKDIGGGAVLIEEDLFAGSIAKPIRLETLVSSIAAVSAPPPPIVLIAAA